MGLFNKKMDLTKLEPIMKRVLNRKFDLDFSYEYGKNSIKGTCELTLKNPQTDVTVFLSITEYGEGLFSFYFNQLSNTDETLRRINEYNSKYGHIYTAYVDQFFILERKVSFITKNNVKKHLKQAIVDFFDDDCLNSIKPIIALIKN